MGLAVGTTRFSPVNILIYKHYIPTVLWLCFVVEWLRVCISASHISRVCSEVNPIWKLSSLVKIAKPYFTLPSENALILKIEENNNKFKMEVKRYTRDEKVACCVGIMLS